MATLRHLELLIKELNETVGVSSVAYVRTDDKLTWNVGSYLLERNYGGYNLAQIVNESGATRYPFGSGADTKRTLADKIQAFTTGLSVIRS